MTNITVQANVDMPIEKVWEFWNGPEHITQWAFASDNWEAPAAENDLRTGGKFKTVMAAKDGSAKFDFGGTYTTVIPLERIEYTMDDDRKVSVQFERAGEATKVTETFETEPTHTEDQQRSGWQAIMNNFKKYAERSK